MTNTTYEIKLSGSGYRIRKAGARYIDQPFDPREPFTNGVGVPFESPEAAQAHAEGVVEALIAAEAAKAERPAM